MNRFFQIVIIIMVFINLYGQSMDKIVAKVGREIILQSELEERIQQIKATGNFNEEISIFNVLNDMVESKLIFQKAKDEGYESEEEQIKKMAEEQIRSISTQFETEIEFKRELTKAGLNLPDLKNFYIEQLTQQSMKEQIITQEIKSRINITEVEVKDYYQENINEIPQRPEMIELGMIIRNIKPSKITKDKILLEINKIRDQLIQGGDFAELAKQYSDGPSKKNDGNLGSFGKGTMIKEFEKAAFSLMPGEISDIVETAYGYHIIKVEEKAENEVTASHILKQVNPTEHDIEAEILLMDKIKKEINTKEDFYEAAKTYSEDDSTAVVGGVIGEFPENGFPEMFKEELSKIDIGEYTEVIRKQNSLYIFGKLKLKPERAFDYEEIYDKLFNLVQTEKEIELYKNWINELKQNSYVEILIEE